MKADKAWWWVKVLAAAGMALAVYLLWQQVFRPEFRPCSVNDYINCDAVVEGPVAKTFGVSTPLIGLVGYVVIFGAAVKRWKRVLLGAATFGLGFCLWIAYVELFRLRVICPVCIGCQVVMIGEFGLAMWIGKNGASG